MLETQVTTTRSNLNEFFVKNQGDIEVASFYPMLVKKDLRFCVFYKRVPNDTLYVVDLIYPESWDQFYDKHKGDDSVLFVTPIALPHFQKHVFAILRAAEAGEVEDEGPLGARRKLEEESRKRAQAVKAQSKQPTSIATDDYKADAIASSLVEFPAEELQRQLSSLGNKELIRQVTEEVRSLQNMQVNLSGSKPPARAGSTSVAVFESKSPTEVASTSASVFGTKEEAHQPEPAKPDEPANVEVVSPTKVGNAIDENPSSTEVESSEPAKGKKKRGRPKHDG